MDRFMKGARDFDLFHSFQTRSGAHPVSYPMGTGVLSPEVKQSGCEADHSPHSSTTVKNGGAIPSLPHTSSWRTDSLIKYRDKFMSLPYSSSYSFLNFVTLPVSGLCLCIVEWWDEWWIETDLERIKNSLIEVRSPDCPEGTEKNYECLSLDTVPVEIWTESPPPEYEYTALPLPHLLNFIYVDILQNFYKTVYFCDIIARLCVSLI
jgi:hypothetical protein